MFQKINLSFFTFLLLQAMCFSIGFAQTTIKMEKVGGVYKIPCKVNGLSLKFIFDTGASDVSLSLTEAIFMLKNGLLSENDFTGTEYYRIANGDIQEGTKVNLKSIELGDQKIYNVEASITHTLDAPLLFGQSALQRFGKFSIDYSTNNLILGYTGTSTSTLDKDNLDKLKPNQSILPNEINEDDYGGITYGTYKDSIWKGGKKILFVKDNSTLIKNAFTTASNDLNMGVVKLEKVVYVFSDRNNRFYKIYLQGSFNDAQKMKAILKTKFGDYDHENGYDDVHITQWVFKDLTITMKVIESSRYEITMENSKYYW